MSRKFLMLNCEMASRKDITSSAKLVFAAICDHIGHNQEGWPGERTLAVELGLNRETVMASIRQLEISEMIAVERSGNGLVNRYRLAGKSSQLRDPKPAGKSSHSGRKIQPVVVAGKSDIVAGKSDMGGRKIQPQVAGKSDTNHTHTHEPDPITKPKPAANSAADSPPTFRDFTDEFCAEWKRTHGAAYPFQAKDGVAASKIWKYAQGDIAVAMDIVIRYLLEPGDFYAGHPLTKLAADLPRFAAADPDGIGDPNRGDGGRNATPAEIAMLQEAGLSPKEPPA